MKATKWPRKWTAALALIIAASPIGILLVWNYGDAWGEWGNVGSWVPRKFWSAPIPDYNFSGWNTQLAASLGYIISAVVGVTAIILLTYALGLLTKKRELTQTKK